VDSTYYAYRLARACGVSDPPGQRDPSAVFEMPSDFEISHEEPGRIARLCELRDAGLAHLLPGAVGEIEQYVRDLADAVEADDLVVSASIVLIEEHCRLPREVTAEPNVTAKPRRTLEAGAAVILREKSLIDEEPQSVAGASRKSEGEACGYAGAEGQPSDVVSTLYWSAWFRDAENQIECFDITGGIGRSGIEGPSGSLLEWAALADMASGTNELPVYW
jgi:hypothetical protein